MRPEHGTRTRDPRLVVGLAVVAALGLAALAPSRAADGDAAAGQQAFGRACGACHTVTGENRIGPSLKGIAGKTAGAVAGFDSSPAMAASGVVWTAETLDRFIAAPRAVVPGTRMVYAGLRNEQQRRDIVAYLLGAN